MKITTGQLYNMQSALKSLVETKNIRASLSMRIVRLVKTLDSELRTVLEQRDKLIVQYGEKKDGGHAITPEMPGFKAWLDAFNDMLKVEIDVPVEPVELPEDTEIAPMTLLALEPLVTVAEGKPELRLVK